MIIKIALDIKGLGTCTLHVSLDYGVHGRAKRRGVHTRIMSLTKTSRLG